MDFDLLLRNLQRLHFFLNYLFHSALLLNPADTFFLSFFVISMVDLEELLSQSAFVASSLV